MAGKDQNIQLKVKTHSTFFTIPSALEELSSCQEEKQDPFMALSLHLRPLVQNSIISIDFATCQTGFPSKK